MVGLEEPVVRAMETNRVGKGEKRIPNTSMRGAGSSKEGGKEEKRSEKLCLRLPDGSKLFTRL